ncbi:MAG: hypothetical protein PHH26_00595 [Candidatus Thermoplasmatota archaeon]|nr:hypothetical protein [Candidatus Thermoplasmatota archaeon]
MNGVVAENQLTFEMLLNPSVLNPEDEARLSAQALQIYRLFKIAERMRQVLTTSDLAQIGRQYNARINEVRHALVKVGLMIDESRGKGGNNYYRVVPLEQSTFWSEKVVKKGLEYKWL